MPPFLSCLLMLFVNPSCYLFSGSHVLEWNVRLIVSDNVEMENLRRLNITQLFLHYPTAIMYYMYHVIMYLHVKYSGTTISYSPLAVSCTVRTPQPLTFPSDFIR